MIRTNKEYARLHKDYKDMRISKHDQKYGIIHIRGIKGLNFVFNQFE